MMIRHLQSHPMPPTLPAFLDETALEGLGKSREHHAVLDDMPLMLHFWWWIMWKFPGSDLPGWREKRYCSKHMRSWHSPLIWSQLGMAFIFGARSFWFIMRCTLNCPTSEILETAGDPGFLEWYRLSNHQDLFLPLLRLCWASEFWRSTKSTSCHLNGSLLHPPAVLMLVATMIGEYWW